MSKTEQNIRTKVKQLLDEGKIRYCIGYEPGSDAWHVTPGFIFDAKDAEKIVFNPLCANNLVGYLTDEKKRELKKGEKADTRPIALLVKGCDSKALIQLLSENQIQRSEVIILGVPCNGIIDTRKLEKQAQEMKVPAEALNTMEITRSGNYFTGEWKGKKYSFPAEKTVFNKCLCCVTPNPLISDELFGDTIPTTGAKNYTSVEEIEALPVEKRWEFWSEQFSRCIRCSACKNICPLCYCKECAVDSADIVITPQTTSKDKANKMPWVEKNSELPENIFFHLTRMMHMAGRCINCGECERACPMNIPLGLLTKKIEKDAKELFGYEAGFDPEAKSLLSIFEEGDPGDFIK